MSDFDRLPSFRHLRVFEAIAEARSFSRGAASVHLSQPAATQAVMNLEKWAKAALFYRNKGGTYLTEEGAVFLKYVRSLFAQVEGALAHELFAGSPDRAKVVAPRIKSSHVKILLAISEFTSLDIAAHALGQTRAAIQRITRDLEALLGCRLFERTSRGVSANPLGIRISSALQRASLEIRRALEEIEALQERSSARLFIGAQPLSSTSLLAASINDLLALHPQTQIRIVEGSYRYLLHELQAGRLDMMFGALKRPNAMDNVIEISLFHEPYCVAARADHPLTKATKVTLDHLASYEWVLPGPGTQRRQAFETLFRDHPARPAARIDATSVSAQIALLTSSDRLALLTPLELALDPHMNKLAQLTFDTKIERNPDGVTVRAGWAANAAQSAFLDCLTLRVAKAAPAASIAK